jgi:histone H3/H4
MKIDPDIKLCQKNAYILIGKLSELFLQQISRESVSVAKMQKRKTLAVEDLCNYF